MVALSSECSNVGFDEGKPRSIRMNSRYLVILVTGTVAMFYGSLAP
jgi:hypothetical protein